MENITQTFLDLVAFDETFPNEDQVLQYIKDRLNKAKTPFKQDGFRNIVATIEGRSAEAIALSGHVDIAAPLQGREVLVEGDIIKTDGKGLLGGDDKTAVVAMLELADYFYAHSERPVRTVELIFTVGEEAGCKGAVELDYSLVTAKQVLVFDWLGAVNHVIAQSPAYFCFDITYKGKDAHPAEWQQGKNAGAALVAVAAGLQQGEYAPGVIFNIGKVQIGNARNKVPGLAELRAEARSFDKQKVTDAAKDIKAAFRDGLKQFGLDGDIHVYCENTAYNIDKQSPLLADVTNTLQTLGLQPVFDTTYGCFDGNIFAAHGMDVIILGAGYYNPHSPDEYVNIPEFRQVFEFLKQFALPSER